MSKRKLKVGDKVRIKVFNKRPYGWNILGDMDHYMGKVVTVDEVEAPLFWTEGWCFHFDECEPIEKEVIVIYREGNTVTAHNKVTNEKAIAKCAPEDKFDFNIGAKLAFDRLMGVKTEEPKKKERKFNKGDIVKVIKSDFFMPVGVRGVVVSFDDCKDTVFIDFGVKYPCTHNGSGEWLLPKATGLWYKTEYLEKVNQC